MSDVERKRASLLEPASQPLLKKQRLSPTASDNEESNGVDHDINLEVRCPCLYPTPPTLGLHAGTDLVPRPLVWFAQTQNFRKEAIWREMQEYRRQFERAQRTIDSLEKERARCEARLSAVDYSWNQVRGVSRLAVRRARRVSRRTH